MRKNCEKVIYKVYFILTKLNNYYIFQSVKWLSEFIDVINSKK